MRSMGVSCSNSIPALCEETLIKVFSSLQQEDIVRASMVCRDWQLASHAEHLWRRLSFCISQHFPSFESFSQLSSKFSTPLTSLDLTDVWFDIQDDEWIMLATKLPHLEDLRVSDGHTGCIPVISHWPLKCLTLRLHADHVKHFTIAHTSLHELNLKCPTAKELVLHCPSLTSLSLTDCWALNCLQWCDEARNDGTQGTHLSKLTHLEFSRLNNLSEGSLITIQLCTSLHFLKISLCDQLNETILSEILSSCQQLTSFQVESSTEFHLLSRSIQFPSSIENLSLKSIRGLTNSIFSTSLSHTTDLTTLHLEDCSGLNEELRLTSFPSLVSLSLADCSNLCKLEVKCAQLTQLNVEDCSSLQSVSVERQSLRRLWIWNCSSVAAFVLTCASLEQLDARKNKQLDDDWIASLAVACHRLRKLNLSGCQGITGLGFRHLACLQKLEDLNLAATTVDNLNPLFESCRWIKRLNLNSCASLSDASLEPLTAQWEAQGVPPVFPHLEWLDISRCGFGEQVLEGLAMAGRESGRGIKFLTARNCLNIKRVSISNCPGLLELYLDESCNLMSVHLLACPDLRVLSLNYCYWIDFNEFSELQVGQCPKLMDVDVTKSTFNVDKIAKGLPKGCRIKR